MSRITVGVLALQGAFAKHAAMLRSIGANAIEVRKPADLEKCDALIIPGGESTTIMRQINFIGLETPLRNFSQTKPVFGTCAGLILMSNEVLSDKMEPFRLLNIKVERNAFGRQAESFKAELDVRLQPNSIKSFPAVFIRAPRIRECCEDAEVLASWEGEPVLVRQGMHLGATFHPELTEDPLIHNYFKKIVEASKGE